MSNPETLLVFDAVGTLIRPVESISTVYQRIGGRYGVDLARPIVKQRFHKCRNQIFGNQPDQPSSDTLEKDRWRNLVKRVFVELIDSDDLFEDLWNHYANPKAWMLFPEIQKCISAIPKHGILLAIGSNFDSRLYAICKAFEPLHRFEQVFCSATVGFCKPDPRFFHRLVESFQFQEEPRCIMVGDDPVKDAQAAENAGFEGFHLNRPDQDLFQLLVQAQIIV